MKNYDEVVAYKEEAAKKSDFERTELAKDKTGVKLEQYGCDTKPRVEEIGCPVVR